MRNIISKFLDLEFNNKILIFDYENLCELDIMKETFVSEQFKIYRYESVEGFRLTYESEIRNKSRKNIVIVNNKDIYIPYDIRKEYKIKTISMKLLTGIDKKELDKEGIDIEYAIIAKESERESYIICETNSDTSSIINKENTLSYIEYMQNKIDKVLNKNPSVEDWILISEIRAKILKYSLEWNVKCNFHKLDMAFKEYIFTGGYKNLSTEIRANKFPSILPQIMQRKRAEKTALVVMDGMSMFDFINLKTSLIEFEYTQTGTFALIPTTTPISRQCIFSGKYPIELDDPFRIRNEEKEFIEAGINLGYQRDTILFKHGYSLEEVRHNHKLLGIIINDIDNFVHGSTFGKKEMKSDISNLDNSGKLTKMINELIKKDFEIILTSDHGNTECVGIGQVRGLGVLVETRSNRMIVNKKTLSLPPEVYNECYKYPGYYISSDYNYFVCKDGLSFDIKDKLVNNHGSINIEEVIVPYVHIKRRK